MKIIKCSCDTNDVGSARKLTGRIYTLCFFVSYEGKPWTREGIDRVLDDLFKAQGWLKKEAYRYGTNIEFVNEGYGMDGDLHVRYIPQTTSNAAYSFPKSLILKEGFDTFDDFVEWAEEHSHCDQYINLVFANIEGRSYACPVTRPLYLNNPHEFTVEACLLYDYYYKRSAYHNSSVYAHEILHLFGAWDLYPIDEKDGERARRAAEHFPRSIMINTCDDIDSYEIDRLTAWLIGISDLAEDWYTDLDPYRER